MEKEMMYCYDFCLFKVVFNQLINKLSFMRVFVIVVSRIKKQLRQQTFKQSADDIKCWYVCDFYPYQSVYQYWLWDVDAFDQHS